MPKPLIAVILTLLLLATCFILGMVVGGTTVSRSDGLAGAAVVFWYGIGGGIIGLVAAIVMITKLEVKELSIAAGVVLVVLFGTILALRMKKNQRDAERARLEQIEKENDFRDFRFGLSVRHPEDVSGKLEGIQHFTTQNRGKRLEVRKTDEVDACLVELTPDQSRSMLEGIYEIGEEWTSGMCEEVEGYDYPVQVVWQFYDNDTPESGNWPVGAACLAKSASIERMIDQLSSLAGSDCGRQTTTAGD